VNGIAIVTATWQFIPETTPLFLTIFLGAGLGVYSWRFRSIPFAFSFTILCAISGLWALFNVVHYGAASFSAKDMLTQGVLCITALLGPVWFLFSVQYAGKQRWLTKPIIAALFLLPLVTVILLATNSLHGLVYLRRYIDPNSTIGAITSDYGIWFWVHSIYSYTLLSVGTLLLMMAALRARSEQRWRGLIVATSALIPMAINILYITRLVSSPIDYTPVTISISLLLFSVVILRYDLFQLAPVALQAVFDNLTDPAFVTDKDLVLTKVNPAAEKLAGTKGDALVGKRALDIFPHEAARIAALKDAGDGKTQFRADRQWFEANVNTLHDGKGGVLGYLCVLHDITTLKEQALELAKARDEALQASQLKTHMLGKITHNLRTPLSAIIGYSDLLLITEPEKLPEDVLEDIRAINDGGNQLNSMISQMIDQTRLQDKLLKLQIEPVNLAELLAKSQSACALAEERNIILTMEIADDLTPRLLGDPQRLHQIIANLLSNAIKFTRKGGSIQLRLSRYDMAHWSICVTDTGIGIAKEDHSSIFEPFHQVAIDVTHARKGSGLGLAFVRDLVSFMGGRIELTSEVGKGSTFEVILPLRELTVAYEQ
jgi:PAS domain S-box-containing protein